MKSAVLAGVIAVFVVMQNHMLQEPVAEPTKLLVVAFIPRRSGSRGDVA